MRDAVQFPAYFTPQYLHACFLQTKLVSTMDDLAPLATGVEDGSTPKLGQELLHNVGLMVGLAETEIQVCGGVSSGWRDVLLTDFFRTLSGKAAVLLCAESRVGVRKRSTRTEFVLVLVFRGETCPKCSFDPRSSCTTFSFDVWLPSWKCVGARKYLVEWMTLETLAINPLHEFRLR